MTTTTDTAPEQAPEYEGSVIYADGSVVSLQCFEGRRSECPDEHCRNGTDPGPCESGPLQGTAGSGYFCEAGAGSGHVQELADAEALDQIAEIFARYDAYVWSGDLAEVVRTVARTGRKVQH